MYYENLKRKFPHIFSWNTFIAINHADALEITIIISLKFLPLDPNEKFYIAINLFVWFKKLFIAKRKCIK